MSSYGELGVSMDMLDVFDINGILSRMFMIPLSDDVLIDRLCSRNGAVPIVEPCESDDLLVFHECRLFSTSLTCDDGAEVNGCRRGVTVTSIELCPFNDRFAVASRSMSRFDGVLLPLLPMSMNMENIFFLSSVVLAATFSLLLTGGVFEARELSSEKSMKYPVDFFRASVDVLEALDG